MSQYETLLYTTRNRVATITLNRPQVRNAFNATLRRELGEAVRQAIADDEVRAVVIAGAGQVFCAGADLGEATSSPSTFLPHAQLDEEYKPVFLTIMNAPKPFLSAVNGAAAGVGSSLAMVCDLTLMADNASIYQAFGAIGLIPDGGATWHLVRTLGRKRAYDLIISGERLSAARCVELGLANRVAPAAELMDAAQCWAEELAEKAPLALRYAKQALNKAVEFDLADTISYEGALQNFCTRSADAQEGMKAFLEKRKPVFVGR